MGDDIEFRFWSLGPKFLQGGHRGDDIGPGCMGDYVGCGVWGLNSLKGVI